MRRVVNSICLLMVLFGAVAFTTPAYASVAVPGDLGLGPTAAASKAGNENLKSKLPSTLPDIIGQAIGAVLAFVGVIFFILTLYGGFTWMLAHGKEEYTRKAKDTIFGAAIGLLIVLGSYAITQFVIEALQDSDPPQQQDPQGPPIDCDALAAACANTCQQNVCAGREGADLQQNQCPNGQASDNLVRICTDECGQDVRRNHQCL